MDELITYAQAATLLNVKIGTVYSFVSLNRIPHVRLGRRLVRFSKAALDAWVRERTVEPGK